MTPYSFVDKYHHRKGGGGLMLSSLGKEITLYRETEALGSDDSNYG